MSGYRLINLIIHVNQKSVKTICIPEGFNTHISHHLFDYKITLVNSQHENSNLKSYFVLKNRFQMYVLMISGMLK